MTSISMGRKRSGKKRFDHIDNLGCWTRLLDEKLFGPEGDRLSSSDVLLRQEYKRAAEGDVKAIQTVMAMLEAALEQEKGPRKAHDPFYRAKAENWERAEDPEADLRHLARLHAYRRLFRGQRDRCLARLFRNGSRHQPRLRTMMIRAPDSERANYTTLDLRRSNHVCAETG